MGERYSDPVALSRVTCDHARRRGRDQPHAPPCRQQHENVRDIDRTALIEVGWAFVAPCGEQFQQVADAHDLVVVKVAGTDGVEFQAVDGEDEQALPAIAGDHPTAREEGVVAPQPAVARVVVGGERVEEGDLGGRVGRRVVDAQTAGVVRFEDEVAIDVQIVVDRRVAVRERAGEDGVVEVGHVDDPRGRRGAVDRFVELIVHVQRGLVFRQPRLMDVAAVVAQRHAEFDDVALVGDVEDDDARVEPAAVGAATAEEDLTPGVRSFGIGDDLRVVDVVAGPGADEGRVCRVGVQVVDAGAAKRAADAVEVPAGRVDHHVVAGVPRRTADLIGDRNHAVVNVAQVDDLDADPVAARFGDLIGVMRVRLDIAPEAVGPQDCLDDDRIVRVGDLHDAGAGRTSRAARIPGQMARCTPSSRWHCHGCPRTR